MSYMKRFDLYIPQRYAAEFEELKKQFGRSTGKEILHRVFKNE